MQNGSYKTYTLTLALTAIEQFVKGLFAGGVPYRHLKVLDQERTNHLIQDQEQENLPQREMRKSGIDITNTMHSSQDWS